MRLDRGWMLVLAVACVPFALPARVHAEDTERGGSWVLPDERLGIRTAPLLLLSRPDVQADLRLEQPQVAGTQTMINELTRRAAALRGKTGSSVMVERRAIDEAQLEWLANNLTGRQLERLRQVELQWEGESAMLSRPMVAQELELAPEQRQALARILADRNRLRSQGPTPPQIELSFRQKSLSILSAAQQQAWHSLLGTPIRFATATAPKRDDAARQAGYPSRR